MVTLVMFKAREKISGIMATPTLTPLAVRNGVWLNLGSSAITRFSAESEPVKRDRLRFAACTWRARAVDAFASIVGLNWLTGIRNGTITRITITIPTAIR